MKSARHLNLSGGQRAWLGFASVWPLTYLTLLTLLTNLVDLTGTIGTPATAHSIPLTIIVLVALHAATMVVGFAVMAFDIWYVLTGGIVQGAAKTGWVVALVILSIVSIIVFYWRHLRVARAEHA